MQLWFYDFTNSKRSTRVGFEPLYHARGVIQFRIRKHELTAFTETYLFYGVYFYLQEHQGDSDTSELLTQLIRVSTIYPTQIDY
jgi:hypothetical protein